MARVEHQSGVLLPLEAARGVGILRQYSAAANIHLARGDPIVLPGQSIMPVAMTVDNGKNGVRLAQFGFPLTADGLGTSSSNTCHGTSAYRLLYWFYYSPDLVKTEPRKPQ